MGMVPNISRVRSMFRGPKTGLDMSNPAPLTTAIRSYRDLRVWQQSMDLAETIYQVTKTFPDTERYVVLRSQWHQTSRKVMHDRWEIMSDIWSFPADRLQKWKHN